MLGRVRVGVLEIFMQPPFVLQQRRATQRRGDSGEDACACAGVCTISCAFCSSPRRSEGEKARN